jgi:hypothetical protein
MKRVLKEMSRIKYRLLSLTVVFLLCVTLFCAAGWAAEPTARDWMESTSTERSLFILGYVQGLKEFLSLFRWELREKRGRISSADTLNNALYRRLLDEPELRAGPIRAILFRLLDDFYVITDQAGDRIASWEKLLSTSDCADILKKYRAGTEH